MYQLGIGGINKKNKNKIKKKTRQLPHLDFGPRLTFLEAS